VINHAPTVKHGATKATQHMTKSRSQVFMELFSEKKILTVSKLTTLIRDLLEENFEHIWVEGEVSNLATPSSGHLYFTLKDSRAMIRCIMFRNAANALKFRISDGMKLVLKGRLTVYDQRGEYQIIAEYMEPQGVGALQLAFQQLKKKLADEGLFAEERKKTLPFLPKKIGLVTSPTGAAIHDILNIINRRHANVNIILNPVKVQGEGAAAEIAQAIKEFNSYKQIDVMIIGRGGGSIEDLWAFNEEVVARAIFASKIPVISAVGHEIDFTIADFVADLRAPTPSAAAELVVKNKSELESTCTDLKNRLLRAIGNYIEDRKTELKYLKKGVKSPELVIAHFLQHLDSLRERIEYAINSFYSGKRVKTESLIAKLNALSPLSTLSRGYATVHKLPSLDLVRRREELSINDKVLIRFIDGALKAAIEED